jgi:hypothetical protein
MYIVYLFSNTTKVPYLDVIVPPRLMPKEFQLLVYILHFWGLEMNEVISTSYFVINKYKIQILYYKKNLPLLN